MPRKLCFSIWLALVYLGLVAFQPRLSAPLAPMPDNGAARLVQRAADVTATAPAPTAAPTPEIVDTTQPMAAVALIWAVIIIVVAVTVFLIWRTRPKPQV